MPVTEVTLIRVDCEECGEPELHFEYETPALFQDMAVAIDQLITNPTEPEMAWQLDEDGAWHCYKCLAAAACRAAGGHDWGPWSVYDGRALRTCERSDYCGGHEHKSVETGAPL